MKYDIDTNEILKSVFEKIVEDRNKSNTESFFDDILTMVSENVLPVLFANEIIKNVDALIEGSNKEILNSELEYKIQLKKEDVYGALIFLLAKRMENEEDMDEGFVETDPA